jgi:tetratricopeptide (TPR) repeat protein
MTIGIEAMRRAFWWQLAVLLLLAGPAALAQVPDSNPKPPPSNRSPAAGAAPAGAVEAPEPPTTLEPGVTIAGKTPHGERPLPKLPPDEFTRCMRMALGFQEPEGGFAISQYLMQAAMCEHQLDWEEHTVLEACLDRDGKQPLPRVVQACTESLEHGILPGKDGFFLLASRAEAYFAYGDPRHALADYTAAIKLAPDNAELHYDRGVLFAAQADDAAALRDFDAAIALNSRLVPALRQRARLYEARGNLSGALADYSQAIGLEPKAAALWSDRGHVDLRQHDYRSAVKDEAEAIQLDPKLALAYFLRSVAFGDLGEGADAVSDLRTAVGLDPSLARYVTIQGKTVSLGLPPL